MRNQILNFPSQLSQGVELARDIKIDKTYEKVVVCGMGGSGIAGEMLLFWQEVSGMLPVVCIHRDYDLPSWVSKNDLVVCISWSGNTEEALSCYEAAIKSDIPAVSITTGGKLAELSKKHKTPLVLIPDKDLPPRMGVGYMTAVLFQLIGLGEKITTISLDPVKTEAEGKKLADKIDGMTPLLYSSYKWRVLPRLWKILFNENDKIHAFWNYFPGMAHNELVGFTDEAQDRFFPIFFKDAGNDKRQNKNIDTAIAILDKQEYNYSIVNLSSSDNPLETVLNGYILGLWTSFYLAKKLGVDPEKTKLLEEYKELRY
ncbi:MAG: hypothetical protein A3G03_00835 [Candidatus Taylorbacteria bacterium RIFCSPLOWO2_12_FULL_44_15c]|uniref:SIS domain-containing protein n=1 Tax=Candidatus Taylorbacteria bacterium RIFCSPLOWO2_12_FULL_44_15c TaxID=1802333 RepID=A0A1G2P8E3_9BACT|nr:MAG: hypothetical protein A3G03_00835 [Candidatus Taylorbacteria bacterium RIFCSPLOWO2_12_FULL_44_15c]HXK40998.1 SIS domain-containing protein [Candidatus Paceibacterota bacterium]